MSKRRFDKEFKINAIKLITEQNLSMLKVIRDLDIGLSTLQRWKRELVSYGLGSAFPGSGKLKTEDEMIRKLERENEVLRKERDILKKALAIFSSQ